MELRSVILQFTTLLILIKTADTLKCYQCDSTLDHNCQEYFDHENPNIQLKATECTMYDAKYCLKITGIWGGIVGTHRSCSSRDMGDQCQDLRFPDHSRKYRGCIYTCSSDGCNSANGINFSLPVVVLSLVSFVVAMVLRR